jgi:lipase maturation factor 1
MWFAALGRCEENPWLVRFLGRLQDGSPSVRALLKHDPFPDAPPRLLRTTVHDYHFTRSAERARTGAWWRREAGGPYCPVLVRTAVASSRGTSW